MELKDLKLEDAQAKVEELKGVSEPTNEQKTELTEVETYVNEFTEYNGLREKEGELNDDDAERLINLGDKFATVAGEVTPKEKEPEETAPPAGAQDKKYAGVYVTLEDLINGIKNSETGLDKLVEKLTPEQVTELEEFYKDNQKVVSRINETKKKPSYKPATPQTDVSKIPLNQRRLNQMSNSDYANWEKEDKMAAHSWLTRETSLSTSQDTSRRKVFAKYKTWLAEINGIISPSKELIEFDRIQKEREAEFMGMPNGPEVCMEEMEGNMGIGKPAKPAPKAPPKKPAKPGFEQGPAGKGGGAPAGKSAVSADDFEKMSPEEQDSHMEKDVFKEN